MIHPSNVCIANIKEYNGHEVLSEVGQQLALRFSILSDNLYQIHKPVVCRDFLHDIVRSNVTGKSMSIYGLHYDPEHNKTMNKNRLTMSVEFPINTVPSLLNIRILLRTFERMLWPSIMLSYTNRKTPTLVWNVANMTIKKGRFIIIVSSPIYWASDPAYLSLHTLLIKIAQRIKVDINEKITQEKYKDDYYRVKKILSELLKEDFEESCTINGYSTPLEILYLRSIFHDMDCFLKNHGKIIDTNKDGFSDIYYKDIPIGDFHEAGITGFFNGVCRDSYSKMKEMEEVVDKKGKGLRIYDGCEGKTNLISLSNNGSINSFKKTLSTNVFIGTVTKENEKRYLKSVICPNSTFIVNKVAGMLKDSKTKDNVVDLKDTRVLLVTNKFTDVFDYPRKIKLAKEVINIIEKAAGVKDKTVIGNAVIDFSKINDDISCFLITGDGMWTRSPQLFYTFCSILTTLPTVIVKDSILKLKTITDVENMFSRIVEINKAATRKTGVFSELSGRLNLLVKHFKDFEPKDVVAEYEKVSKKSMVYKSFYENMFSEFK